MKAPHLFSTVLLFFLIASCSASKKSKVTDGWTPLFEKEASSWTTTGDAQWDIRNGVLEGTEGAGIGYAITTRKYRNFHLKAEFYPDETVNSGIFFRCKGEQISATECFEANIWDEHTNQDYRTGALVTRAKPLVKVETVNKWNEYEIKAEGKHVQLWVNGQKTADLMSEDVNEGIIALQIFKDGVIRFRNVRIKELE